MRRGDERESGVLMYRRVMLMKVSWKVLFLEVPWGSRRGWRNQTVWAFWVSFPGRQAGCGLERKWEFFDFEISREERQTFWVCLCDGGAPLKCSPSSGYDFSGFSLTHSIHAEKCGTKRREYAREGGVVSKNLGKKNR